MPYKLYVTAKNVGISQNKMESFYVTDQINI